MIQRLILLTVFLVAPVVARGQVETGKTSPDRLSLGIVRVGATVEASVRVFEAGDDTAGVPFAVVPFPFLRVTQTRLGTQAFGDRGKFRTLDIMLSIDTAREAEYEGFLEVRLGEEHFVVPVTADVRAPEPDQARVLVLESPFSRFSTDDATLFNPWLELVKSTNIDVHYFHVDRSDSVLRETKLSEFDVVLLSGEALIFARPLDFTRLTRFMEDGGRVIVAANHFMMGSVGKANELLEPNGLRMEDVEPRESQVDIDESGIADDPLTAKVKSVKVFRPSPIAVTDEDAARILVACPPFPEKGFVAVAKVGNGELVVLGASLWWNWIASEQEKGADNAALLKNLLTEPRD